MQLRVGSLYLSRGGDHVEIYHARQGLTGTEYCGDYCRYYSNGVYSGGDTRFDLIKELSPLDLG